MELPAGTSLATSRDFVEAVAADLRENGPGVDGTFVTVGGGSRGEVNKGKVRVVMTPAGERSFHQEHVMAWTRERYADVKNAVITAAPVAQVGGDSGFRQQAVQFNIRGRDEQAIEAARRIGAARTYFTHITHQLAHAATNDELPDGMALAHDGLRIELP